MQRGGLLSPGPVSALALLAGPLLGGCPGRGWGLPRGGRPWHLACCGPPALLTLPSPLSRGWEEP